MVQFEELLWYNFLLVAIVVILISIGVTWFRNYARSRHLPITPILEMVADWTPFVSGMALVLLFIVLNPLTHFIIIIGIIVLFYNVIKNVIAGIPLRPLYRSLLGKWVSVKHYEGVMLSYDRRGIHLAEDDTKSYIPNEVIHQHGIKALKYNLAVSLSILCQVSLESSEKSLPINQIMDRIMSMPYTMDKANVKLGEETLEIEAKFSSEKYSLKFIKALQELNLSVVRVSKK